MGFLVAGLLAPEIAILEDEVREIEKDLKLTRKNVVK
jgi:hypothetical protein